MGGVLVVITMNQFSRLRGDCGSACPPSDWEKYRTTQTVGDVLLIAGGAAVAAGAAWWILQPTPKSDVRAWIAPLPGAVAAGVGF